MKKTKKLSTLIYVVLAYILFISFPTAVSAFTCNSGTLATTCTITGANTTTDGEVISGAGSLIIASGGSITSSGASRFTLNMGGNITIQSGGSITGNAVITTTNLDVQSGGSINVDSKGYYGVDGTGKGNGPGGGFPSAYGSYDNAGGAGHGGVGATGSMYSAGLGGTGYGSATQPTDFGSSGGHLFGYIYTPGRGGGAIKITASGTVTVNGTISAKGEDIQSYSTRSATMVTGAGSGGSIWITADTITGSANIVANGGNVSWGHPAHPGKGAGGRIALYYTNFTHTGLVSAYSGIDDLPLAYRTIAGAGTIFKKAVSQPNGELIADNGTISPAGSTYQSPGTTDTFDNVIIRNYASYVVQNGSSVTILAMSGTGNAGFVNNGTANLSSISLLPSSITNTGTIILPASVTLGTGATFTNSGTINTLSDLTISGGTFVANGGSFSAGSPNIIVGSGGVFESNNTPDNPFVLNNLTVQSGGVVRHVGNGINSLNLSLTNLDVQPGGSINVNGKGYYGTDGYTNGNGPGKGFTSAAYYYLNPGGAGHGGIGGAGTEYGAGAGGVAYGSEIQPITLGSSGGSTGSGDYPPGSGGGAIKITASGTVTVNGTISANGEDAKNYSLYSGSIVGGGGSGGSIWITADTILGSSNITANGGGVTIIGPTRPGGGGGGRIAMYCTGGFDYSGAVTANAGVTTANFPGAGTVYDEDCMTHAITSSAGPNGTISPLGETKVNHEEDQLYTVTPDVGYRVDHVLVDGVSVGEVTTYTFTNVIARHTIEAVFIISPPASPSNFTATAGACEENFLDLAWDASLTATNYKVYRDETLIYNSTGLSHLDSGLVLGQTYSYHLTASNIGGISATTTINGTVANVCTRTLTINTAGTGTGTVFGAGEHDYGTTVTPTATPGSGSSFAGWSGACNPTTGAVLMDDDKTCIATFTLNPPPRPTGFTASPSACENNWLNLSWDVTPGATMYQIYRGGTLIRDDLSANFDIGEPSSLGFSDTGLVFNSTYSYTITASNAGGTSQVASASGTVSGLCTRTLTINKTGSGFGVVTGAGEHTPGAEVVATASANTGSTFTGWSGEGCSGTGTCSVIMDIDREITATFVLDPIPGMCSSPASNKEYPEDATSYGTDDFCSQGTVSVDGTTPSEPAFPPRGGMSTWVCLGINNGATSPECWATRATLKHAVTIVESTGGGKVIDQNSLFINCGGSNLDCQYNYNEGSTVALQAIPESTYWQFDYWTGDCSGTSPVCLLPITGPQTASANFVLTKFNYQEF
ncbi:MAG: hypothetical protein A2566_02085 [Candidatus Zambryskibacteria bacterium RIFOXYD1_FULL_40_13]|nr:MAG: hypothetical protein A2566_02085 [Candidatus Zambryskibacteria bacterium RIFOXYD1_FULL_40_13]